ncbi:MAG: pyrimidine 5'-nucleotidase [Litoreibacter sp.]
MIASDFNSVRTWVFDLDNTLYPPHMRLFDQIEEKMAAWIIDLLKVDRSKADQLRTRYWRDHGTTLAGLMLEHEMAPEQFLRDVHDIDFSVLTPDPDLRAHIANLPGRKIIYTNGTAPYARRVAAARGLDGLFDAVYGIEHANYRPKPDAAAFKQVFAIDGLDGNIAAMFEDEARNLAYPHSIGMQTVHVAKTRDPGQFISHHTEDLSSFLQQVLG